MSRAIERYGIYLADLDPTRGRDHASDPAGQSGGRLSRRQRLSRPLGEDALSAFVTAELETKQTSLDRLRRTVRSF